MSRVRPAFQLVSVVAIPFSSSTRAISPTDWQQSGQDGTSKVACAPSSWAISRMTGAVSSITRVTSGW